MRLLLLLLLPAAFAAAPKTSTESTVPTKRPSDEEIGETAWRTSCSSCHGATGKGDGPAAGAVVGGVPSLAGKLPADDAGIPAVVDVVQDGRGRMPAFSDTMARGDMRLTVLYIRDVVSGRKQARVETPEKAELEDADAAPAEE